MKSDSPYDLLIRCGRIFCADSGLDGPGGVAISGERFAAAGAEVTVTFLTTADIRNAFEADRQNMNIFMVSASGGPNQIFTGDRVRMASNVKLFLGAAEGDRDDPLDVDGLGYKGDLTATSWLDNGVDLDGDGDIDTTRLTTVSAAGRAFWNSSSAIRRRVACSLTTMREGKTMSNSTGGPGVWERRGRSSSGSIR